MSLLYKGSTRKVENSPTVKLLNDLLSVAYDREIINDKEYNAKPFDFNMICDFEDMGVALKAGGTTTIRGYLALCGNMTLEEAGKELSEQFVKYENFDSINEAMGEEMGDSDFFQALVKVVVKKVKEKKAKK